MFSTQEAGIRHETRLLSLLTSRFSKDGLFAGIPAIPAIPIPQTNSHV